MERPIHDVALYRLTRLAAAIVMVVWAAEHALYPLLASGGGLDLWLAAYRVGWVLPFVAAWTSLSCGLGGDSTVSGELGT